MRSVRATNCAKCPSKVHDEDRIQVLLPRPRLPKYHVCNMNHSSLVQSQTRKFICLLENFVYPWKYALVPRIICISGQPLGRGLGASWTVLARKFERRKGPQGGRISKWQQILNRRGSQTPESCSNIFNFWEEYRPYFIIGRCKENF